LAGEPGEAQTTPVTIALAPATHSLRFVASVGEVRLERIAVQ
jgi:hypothetical protein